MTMEDCHYVHRLTVEQVADDVWETSNECQACRSITDRVESRPFANANENLVNSLNEVATESRPLLVVPVYRLLQIELGFGLDDEVKSHYSPRSRFLTSSHVLPRLGSALCAAMRRSSSAF